MFSHSLAELERAKGSLHRLQRHLRRKERCRLNSFRAQALIFVRLLRKSEGLHNLIESARIFVNKHEEFV